MTQEEVDQLQSKVLEQFKSGKSLFGKEGAFVPMLKQFSESALEAEMDAHPDEGERLEGNKRNGKGKKTIKSNTGPVDIETPRDRQSTFEPQIIKKRETVLADSLQDKIIGLYGLGMSLRYYQRTYQRDVRYRDLPHGFEPNYRPDHSRSESLAGPAIGACQLHCVVRCDALQGLIRK